MQLKALIKNIDSACDIMRTQAITSVSRSLTLRNWIIGYYIVEYEQKGQDRAVYGNKLIDNLSKELTHLKGISATNLRLFRTFYLTYPQIQQTVSGEFGMKLLAIQQTVSTELQIPVKKLINSFTFSHFIEFLRIDDHLKRTFYEVETIKGNWSVRELKRQISSQIFIKDELQDFEEQLETIT